LIWFISTRRLERRLIPRLIAIFVLGGLQGAVGWFMVESGFFPDATAVAPVRLVAHLALALLLYGTVLWTALTLLPPGPRVREAGRLLRSLTWITLGLVALTIVAGGFVAGLHAGLAYNTFPLMDGRLVPEGYADLKPFARNLIANIPAVQFDHRLLASLTLLSVIGLAGAEWPYRARLGWRAGLVAVVQYGLGVTTLLLVVPADVAILHQVCATILLTAVLMIAHAVHYASAVPGIVFPGPGHGQTARDTPFHGSITQSSAEDPTP
jgi:cytochrome c oxidase assembly protein subunit 15